MNNNLQKAQAKPKLFYGWFLVGITWLMLFSLAATATSLYFKPMLDEFGWDRATLSLVGAICMLISAALMPFIGRLIDRWGPRIMMFGTLITQVVSNAVYGLAGNLGAISAGRFLAEFKPTTAAMVLTNRWFTRMRGRALGIASTGTPVGTLILSPVSQYMINTWGWRETLFFWGAFTLVLLLPLTIFVRNNPKDKGTIPDGEQLATVYSESAKAVPEIKESPGDTIKQTLSKRTFWFLAATQMICGIGCGLWMTHIVIFATDMGYSSMIGASFLSVQGGVTMVGVLVTGQLSDFWARHKVLAMTHFIRAMSFVVIVIALSLAGNALWMIYLAMVLFGFGWFSTAPLSGGLVADLFGNQRMGTTIGLTMSAHMIGSAIGTYGGGLVYTLTGSYFDIFVVQGILELAAMTLALGIGWRKGLY